MSFLKPPSLHLKTVPDHCPHSPPLVEVDAANDEPATSAATETGVVDTADENRPNHTHFDTLPFRYWVLRLVVGLELEVGEERGGRRGRLCFRERVCG